MHTLLLAAAGLVALTGSTLSSLPAQADGPDALAFTCTAHLPHFGSGLVETDGTCGDANGGIRFHIGLRDGVPVATTSDFTAQFSYFDSPVVCPAIGSAYGMATFGPTSENFQATRLGAVLIVTLSDGTGGAADLGAAVGTFVVTSPLGNPCGSPVTAQIAGVALGVQ
jgi:hypothetical protein